MLRRRIPERQGERDPRLVNLSRQFPPPWISRNPATIFQSKMIGDAAYESLWYDLSPSESRVLLLLMMRSQKRLTITVGKFTNLSLQQFANVRDSHTHTHTREMIRDCNTLSLKHARSLAITLARANMLTPLSFFALRSFIRTTVSYLI